MSTPDANARFIRDNRREACIIAPYLDHAYPSIDLACRLAAAFGGFTRTDGNGAWINPETKQMISEDVAIYTIAMLDTAFNRDKLIDIAAIYKSEAKQAVVYVRLANGNVLMLGED
jgi:hypothetical protein